MANQELVDYIKRGEAQGFSSQQLEDHLVKNGHDSADVHAAVSAAHGNNIYAGKDLPQMQIPPELDPAKPSADPVAPQASPAQPSAPGPAAAAPKPSAPGGMTQRNPWLVLLLAYVTFGIYMYYWFYTTTKEMQGKAKSAPEPIMFLLMFVPIANIFYIWKYSNAIHEIGDFDVVPLFLLWLFVSPAGLVISQMQLNKHS
ncbi:MAG: DUF4234 domain-containing protein [bacterium]|nr:DUF4234 domain-containing protein [bacterium]